MPIYEYRCEGCGTQFEKLVRNAAASGELACPNCGEKHLAQQFSTFAAHAGGKPAKSESALPPCASGVCPHPGMCGLPQ